MAVPPVVLRAIRPALAVGVLAAVVAHVGGGPFVAAAAHTTVPAVVVALVVTAGVTWCSARRWVLVARSMGLPLDQRDAYAAYYRSQLLNVSLPGGVVGDVQRAWRHGTAVEARGPAARAVVWERAIGTVALALVGSGVLLGMPWALRGGAVTVVGATVGALAVVGLVAIALGRLARLRVLRSVATRDLRALWRSRSLPSAVGLSVAGVAGHLLVLLTALRSTGLALPLSTALPLLVAVLVASTLPTNVAGWGPREGAAAVLFGAVGPGSAAGVTVAATYGVLTLVGALPGVLVLLARTGPVREEVRA